MRWIRDLWFRAAATFAPSRMEREMDEEMAFHMEMEARKLMGEGLSPADAMRQARRRFGDPMREKERARGAWGIGLVQDFRTDARQTIRSLRRSPLFTAVSVLTLGLGIGGATAIFSVVNGVLLKPLPFMDPGGLVSVAHSDNLASIPAFPLSPALYFTFRDHARTLEDIGLYRQYPVTVTGLDRPERVKAIQVTDGLLPLLGIQPIIGRVFTPEETTARYGLGEERGWAQQLIEGLPGSGNPVILTHGYWQRRFGGSVDVLGMTLRVEGTECEIVGVLPASLRLDDYEPEVVLPLILDRARAQVGNFSFPAVARLIPGTTAEIATRELTNLTERATEEYPGISLAALRTREFRSIARPLRETVIGGADRAIWVIFGTVCLVLLIACANVANLFLVRSEARQRDTALRTAMGASRGRIMRHLLTESLVIGLLGGGLGILLAAGALRLFLGLAPPSVPRLEAIGLDPLVLAFGGGVTLFTSFLFGSLPVLRLWRGSLAGSLREGGWGGSASRNRFRARTIFAVTQVAIALVLLVASGLMVRTFQELREIPPGFQDAKEVLTFRLNVPANEIGDPDESTRVHQEVMEGIRNLPGVTSVSGAASVAMDGWESWDDWTVEDFPVPQGEANPLRRLNWMVPGYHETIRNPLLAGRSLEWADIYERRNVALVTENYAREYWGDPQRALGKRIRNGGSSPWREIVGVVGDVYTKGVASEAPLVVYLPFITADFWGMRSFSVRELRYVVRTDRPGPTSLLPEIRQSVWSVNPNLAIADAKTLDVIFGESISRTSFTLAMLAIAAGVALILGIVGVYGVISFIVSQRTREMGVRIAMGATGFQVCSLVLRLGGFIAVVGTSLGLVVAAALTRVMASLLFGVKPVDPITYGAVGITLTAVVVLASYLPARRAASVSPVDSLKWD